MADTDEKVYIPASGSKPKKPGKMKYVVDRRNFLVQAAVVLMALSVLFRLIGYWGFWNNPDSDATYTEVFLPILCCILFIVLIETMGRAALWTTSVPVFLTAVFLILETFGVTPWWVKTLSILLYVVAACIYTVTVFARIRTKWLLVVTIGTPLVYHLAVQDRTTLLNASTPTTLVQWMPEISAMCFLMALLFTALAMEKIVPTIYDGRPDYIRKKIPKYIPPELEWGSVTRKIDAVGTRETAGDAVQPAQAEVPPADEPAAAPERDDEPEQPAQKRRRKVSDKKKITYICLAAAAVLAIIGVVFALVHSSNVKKYQNYYHDGMQYYESGDYESAVTYLEKAVSIDPTDESVMLLADCYAALGQTDKAIALLQKYSGSAAVKKKLEEMKNGGGPDGEVVIAGEKFPADTISVGLSDKGLKSADIAGLAKLSKLQSVTLSQNGITDVSALSGLKNLQVLDLSDNSVTDITPLSGLTSLRTLYLDNNKIEDFTPLYKLTSLTTLSIKGMDITEKQLKEIQDALPDCRVHSEKASEDIEDITIGGVTFKSNVTQLDLSGKGITDISELSKCEDLEKLDLRGNSISDITPLMDIPGLKWLCIKNNRVSDLRPLMGLTRLTYLDAQNNKISSISSVASLGSIQYLYLGKNPVTSFAPLRECTNLLELGLEGTGVKDKDLSYLSSHTSLARLYLENNAELTKTAVDALQKAIPGCKISASALKSEIKLGTHSFPADSESVNAAGLGISDISAASGFTKCVTMLLGNNSISSAAPLSKLTTVKTLDLSGNSISDLTPLSTMTGLQSLNLEGNPISDVSPLLSMTWLKELYISGSNISQEQVDALYSSLAGCNITVEGYTP